MADLDAGLGRLPLALFSPDSVWVGCLDTSHIDGSVLSVAYLGGMTSLVMPNPFCFVCLLARWTNFWAIVGFWVGKVGLVDVVAGLCWEILIIFRIMI